MVRLRVVGFKVKYTARLMAVGNGATNPSPPHPEKTHRCLPCAEQRACEHACNTSSVAKSSTLVYSCVRRTEINGDMLPTYLVRKRGELKLYFLPARPEEHEKNKTKFPIRRKAASSNRIPYEYTLLSRAALEVEVAVFFSLSCLALTGDPLNQCTNH